jgi:hypothetical protein
MRYKVIPAIFFLLLSMAAHTQITRRSPVVFGTEIGGILATPDTDRYSQYWFLSFVPRLDIQLHKGLYISPQVELGFGRYEQTTKMPTQRGFGVGMKYFHVHRNARNSFVRNRIIPYSEASFAVSNYAIDNAAEYGYRTTDRLSNPRFQVLAGVNLRLFGQLYFDYALRGMYYAQSDRFRLANRIGLQYHFGEERTFDPKRGSHDLEAEFQIDGQRKIFDIRYFLKNTTALVRYALVFDEYETGDIFYFKEHNIGIALLTSITSDINVGMLYQPIWIEVRRQPTQRYFMYGPIIQYDFIRNPNRLKLFAESGFLKSNMCTCGDDLPFRENNLSVLPLGFGTEIPIKNTRTFIALSLHFYKALNISKSSTSYGRFAAGIGYRFNN